METQLKWIMTNETKEVKLKNIHMRQGTIKIKQELTHTRTQGRPKVKKHGGTDYRTWRQDRDRLDTKGNKHKNKNANEILNSWLTNTNFKLKSKWIKSPKQSQKLSKTQNHDSLWFFWSIFSTIQFSRLTHTYSHKAIKIKCTGSLLKWKVLYIFPFAVSEKWPKRGSTLIWVHNIDSRRRIFFRFRMWFSVEFLFFDI